MKIKVLLNTKVYLFRVDERIISKNKLKMYTFIAKVQNICNPIGRGEYSIGCILISASILYSLTKNPSNIQMP